MASASSNIIFDDIFAIEDIDRAGKKFDRGAFCALAAMVQVKNYEMELELDFNVELFPLSQGDHVAVALASSLRRGGGQQNAWRPGISANPGLEEDYDYVMFGKIYKYDESTGERSTVYASFGGLLMALTGNNRHLQNLTLGESVYILLRK
ncbi:RNA polymerase [Schizophyllum amplum]|uniref:DNA-directed RNA polymerases I, II, and III subunit RPABC3 n=1 Tax=Schizophyllum amplum TaxID=97359 RepID=A0A550CLY3_9AGAR|nr:RNA polymerase [Auriculariopsis ampla]